MITRREFIRYSMLLSATAILAACDGVITPTTRPIAPTLPSPTAIAQPALAPTLLARKFDAQVLVMGAGMAGITAARELQKRGIKVIVLEARNRIGGRVWTDRSWQNTTLDLGASWIHGVKKNPLSDLVREYSVKTIATDYDAIETYHPDGSDFTDAQRDALDNRFAKLQKDFRAERSARKARGEPDIALGEAIERLIAGQNLSATARRELNYAINTEIEHEYAADVADLSLYNFEEGEDFGGEDVVFPGGYDQLVVPLAQGLDIRLEHMVTKIEHDNNGVKITTNRGELQAPRALITLPLGVLKSTAIEFAPGLPDRKVQAIRRLGMGLLNKVYLRFNAPFWETQPHLLGYVSEPKGEWAEWLNIYKYTRAPILLGFNAATHALALEKLSDREIVAQALQVLRRIYDRVPDPIDAIITRWSADPFARGSYSYSAVGATSGDRDALAEPIENRLFFAGEATERDYPATVHGAYLSGIREAERIAKLA